MIKSRNSFYYINNFAFAFPMLTTFLNFILDNSLPTYDDVITEENEKKEGIEPPTYEEALRMSGLKNSENSGVTRPENTGFLRQDSIGLPNVPHSSGAGTNCFPIQVTY